MNLEEKAEASPTVFLTGSLIESDYELLTKELVEADDLTEPGQFPEFGDFLEVEEYNPVDGNPRGIAYIECPSALARWLVEHEVAVGDRFRVLEAGKDNRDTWQVEAETVDTTGPQSLETAAAMDGTDD